MKVPSAEMEKSRASALSDGATKRGSPGPIGRGYLFEVHRMGVYHFFPGCFYVFLRVLIEKSICQSKNRFFDQKIIILIKNDFSITEN